MIEIHISPILSGLLGNSSDGSFGGGQFSRQIFVHFLQLLRLLLRLLLLQLRRFKAFSTGAATSAIDSLFQGASRSHWNLRFARGWFDG